METQPIYCTYLAEQGLGLSERIKRDNLSPEQIAIAEAGLGIGDDGLGERVDADEEDEVNFPPEQAQKIRANNSRLGEILAKIPSAKQQTQTT